MRVVQADEDPSDAWLANPKFGRLFVMQAKGKLHQFGQLAEVVAEANALKQMLLHLTHERDETDFKLRMALRQIQRLTQDIFFSGSTALRRCPKNPLKIAHPHPRNCSLF